MKSSRALLLPFFLVLAAAPSAAAGGTCGTAVPAGLVAPGSTWTTLGSPYCIEGDIQVSLLTILPGVTVLVDGPYAIDVLTTIQVQGTAESPVTIRAKDPTNPWKGIRFQNTPPGSTFEHAVIQDATESAVTLIDAASPAFDHCAFSNNASNKYGGCIDADDVTGDLVLDSCTFVGNTSSNHGGALRVKMATGFRLDCRDSVFDGNTVNPTLANGNFVGGAAWIEAGDAGFERSSFRNNLVNSRCTGTFGCNVLSRGGALYVGSAGVVDLDNCTFESNDPLASNGGNCFFGGTSKSYGGGLYVAAGTVTARNCIFSCNENTRSSCGASDGGGGVYVNGGTVTLEHCTVARNPDATGIHLAGGTLTVTSSIVYFNDASGSQVGGAPTVTWSNVQGGFTGTGNLDFGPAFAGTGCGALDLSIVLGSPSIDAGDPAGASDACFPYSWGTALPDQGAYGGPLACAWGSGLDASPSSLSVTAGGTQTLSLDAGPDHGGEVYLLLGSLTGYGPGFQYQGWCVPLVWDAYFDYTINNPNLAPLAASFAVLDGAGQAQAQFTIPAGTSPLAIGLRAFHAFASLDPNAPALPTFVSNPVSVLFTP